MDSSTDVLADHVRASRRALDNDLEALRVRTQTVAPRRLAARWSTAVVPLAAGAAGLWLWRRRARSVGSLQHLLTTTLSELYHAERQLLPALERMRDAASNPDLVSLFDRHGEESRVHRERLTRVFRSVGSKPSRGRSAAIAAIAEEADRSSKRTSDDHVRDAWLIAVAQRAEHVEIATYGTARTFAELLGHAYAAQLLQQTLDEERAMDEQLSRLAERFVNPQSIR